MEYIVNFLLSILLLLTISANAEVKYPSSESCNECHENIYREHQSSMHPKSSLFKDEFHATMKDIVNKNEYGCAVCHMPATKNMRAMMSGKEQPDSTKYRQTDGVSCFFCHQIKKIYDSPAHKINYSNYRGDKKPTVFGNLKKPYESNEHYSESNEIYKTSEVCMGCHAHKQNYIGFEVCNVEKGYDKQTDCIGCHMPRTSGTIEKKDKGMRESYVSHEFLGVHSQKMIKKAVKLELSYKNSQLKLTINNKMGHAIITHPMRLKYAKTIITRDSKIIWSNFKEDPADDKEATFVIIFKDIDDKATLPNKALGYKLNRNLRANSSKVITYKVPKLKKGDIVKTIWVSYLINPVLAKMAGITAKDIIKQSIGIQETLTIK
ncbi:MAG: hypothetical protein ACI9RG_000580 [Sulfurimonas sp.]|jgi:hypothetical protein